MDICDAINTRNFMCVNCRWKHCSRQQFTVVPFKTLLMASLSSRGTVLPILELRYMERGFSDKTLTDLNICHIDKQFPAKNSHHLYNNN